MTPIVDSGFHIVGGREVHYRRTGTEGPAVVLVHAFPWSSETLTPLLEMAPRICTVFAVDAPGYGLSEALGGADPDITDYATALDETLASLGVEQFALYGVHSGALVAAALAAQAGSRVTNIVLDGLPLWTTDERAELERRFFPTPRARVGRFRTSSRHGRGAGTSTCFSLGIGRNRGATHRQA